MTAPPKLPYSGAHVDRVGHNVVLVSATWHVTEGGTCRRLYQPTDGEIWTAVYQVLEEVEAEELRRRGAAN